MDLKKTLKGATIKVCRWGKKNAPEILMGAGIVGMVTGTFVAVRITQKKVVPRKNECAKRTDDIVDKAEAGLITVEEADAAVRKEAISCIMDEVKAYAIPVTIEACSVACILASNNIMRKRVAGLSMALTTVSTAFESYRDRVRERYGEDVERSIYLNEKTIEQEVTDEKGKTKKEKITVADPNIAGTGRYLTRTNPNWSDSDTYMDYFFQMVQAELTDRFRSDPAGFMNLNTMYDEFKFKKTGDGLVLGQLYDYTKPAADNKIEITWTKVRLLDENGNPEDAWRVDFPAVTQIYEHLVE